MTLTRPLAALSLVAASALVLAGCSSTSGAEANADGDAETMPFTFEYNTAGEDEEPAYEEVTVDVPLAPENVVIFDMASLDTWGALGGEVQGAPLDSVPDYLQGYLADDAINAGSLFEADLLEVEAAQPDLIIVGGRSAALYEDLSEIAPTVDLSSSGSFEDTLERNVTFLGEVLGAEDEAAAALETLEAGIAEAREVTTGIGTGLSVMVSGDSVSALKPSEGDYSGRNLRGGIVYDVFGVEPVISDIEEATHGEPVSFEFLLETDPDYLFVTDRNAATGEEGAEAAEVVLDNEIVHETTAWQNDQIVYLDPMAWYIVFGGIDTTQIMIDNILSIGA
ncbi:siderophore ABC transporter substrate-binding protein [Microbacterium sp. ZXX196]|uniref:siderophore ABC transporter substrate-binding protein n=1 Tax=Microbacterium sp. ZXX196 TaxID=2609291 RepID=UPI001E54CCDA|nr:ABC transporter substrate-binding protein [Microbacterium sp. ZXX196]